MSNYNFNESLFRASVDKALTTVKTLLDTTRNPVAAAPEVAHEYADKYVLADFLTNTAIAGQLNVLDALGLSEQRLQQLIGVVNREQRTVTLRLKAEERCKHLRTTTREVESPTSHVTTWSGGFTRKDTVVTKVTEYFWQFDATYELVAFRGAGTADDLSVTLQKRSASVELKTLSEATPRPVSVVRPNIDLDLTWLLRHVTEETRQTRFAIDRNDPKRCATPRRNPQVDGALGFWAQLRAWSQQVRAYLANTLLPTQPDVGSLDLGNAQNVSSVFVPVAPLFEKGHGRAQAAQAQARAVASSGAAAADAKDSKGDATEEAVSGSAGVRAVGSPVPSGSGDGNGNGNGNGSGSGAAAAGSGVVPLGLVNTFLAEQRRTLTAKKEALAKTFPSASTTTKLATAAEAWLLAALAHGDAVANEAINGIEYIEEMLYRQLRSAIGKVLQPTDFQAYARFHMRKLYRAQYQPLPFAYAVRRPRYYPEGIVSVEATMDDGGVAEPIHTICASSGGSSSGGSSSGGSSSGLMQFPLDASTRVRFGGERHVHGWINQQFSGSSGLRLQLCARARQFSSFIVMVGRIASANTFEPKHALIVQNKDDLRIPLLLETIPTPKEFRDAIESLSPEQQRFAKGYRAMQLESTLFAVCIVQIKPALERVLNLPDDALTKEIELTQDLLKLFIEYQIPSDLLSYAPTAAAAAAAAAPDGPAARIAQVKAYVSKMKEMTDKNKQSALQEAAERAVYRAAESDMLFGAAVASPTMLSMSFGGPPPPPPAMSAPVMCAAPPPPSPSFSGPPAPMKKMMAPGASKASLPSARAAPVRPSAPPASVPKPSPSPAKPTAAPVARQPVADSKSGGGSGGNAVGSASSSSSTSTVDYTAIPTRLEKAYEELDTDGALRPTIVNPSDGWTKSEKKSLLAEPATRHLGVDEQARERSRAFDLIDALTKSGELALEHAALHVFIAATHCFDKTLVDTVIQQNVNPIERVERSSLIVASTIHGVAPHLLVQPEQVHRLAMYSPHLIPDDALTLVAAADAKTLAADAKTA